MTWDRIITAAVIIIFLLDRILQLVWAKRREAANVAVLAAKDEQLASQQRTLAEKDERLKLLDERNQFQASLVSADVYDGWKRTKNELESLAAELREEVARRDREISTERGRADEANAQYAELAAELEVRRRELEEVQGLNRQLSELLDSTRAAQLSLPSGSGSNAIGAAYELGRAIDTVIRRQRNRDLDPAAIQWFYADGDRSDELDAIERELKASGGGHLSRRYEVDGQTHVWGSGEAFLQAMQGRPEWRHIERPRGGGSSQDLMTFVGKARDARLLTATSGETHVYLAYQDATRKNHAVGLRVVIEDGAPLLETKLFADSDLSTEQQFREWLRSED